MRAQCTQSYYSKSKYERHFRLVFFIIYSFFRLFLYIFPFVESMPEMINTEITCDDKRLMEIFHTYSEVVLFSTKHWCPLSKIYIWQLVQGPVAGGQLIINLENVFMFRWSQQNYRPLRHKPTNYTLNYHLKWIWPTNSNANRKPFATRWICHFKMGYCLREKKSIKNRKSKVKKRNIKQFKSNSSTFDHIYNL